jgi:hypothetical protein
MKLSTDLHSFYSGGMNFMKIVLIEVYTLLKGINERKPAFSAFSCDKKCFTGDVHKNVFSGCKVRENWCSKRHIWGVEV